MLFAPGYTLLPLRINVYKRLILYLLTTSGNVKFIAILYGTPSSSMLKLASGLMTERALKSTRLPIKLLRMRPSLCDKRCCNVFIGRPALVNACGIALLGSLLNNVATLC